jgi:hypothetical protein
MKVTELNYDRLTCGCKVYHDGQTPSEFCEKHLDGFDAHEFEEATDKVIRIIYPTWLSAGMTPPRVEITYRFDHAHNLDRPICGYVYVPQLANACQLIGFGSTANMVAKMLVVKLRARLLTLIDEIRLEMKKLDAVYKG